MLRRVNKRTDRVAFVEAVRRGESERVDPVEVAIVDIGNRGFQRSGRGGIPGLLEQPPQGFSFGHWIPPGLAG